MRNFQGIMFIWIWIYEKIFILLPFLVLAFGVSNLPQSPDIGQNSDEGISDFRIFGQSIVKENCDIIVTCPIYGQFRAIQKPDCGWIVCKTCILIKSNLSFYKNWKQNQKICNRTLTLLFWVKVLCCQNMLIFEAKCWNQQK